MSVIHILKDGTRLDSIRGHVVRMEDAEQAYMVLDAINRKNDKAKPIHKKEQAHGRR